MFRKSSNNPWVSPSGYANTGSFAQIGGTEPVGNRFQGMLGQTIVCSNADALKLSNTSVGTLYQGVYQLVKFNTAIVRGELLFWDTLANNGLNDYEVTHTVTAANTFRAGVALFTDANASGKYGWIQVAGLASLLYANSAPDATLGLGVIQATVKDVPLLTVTTVNTTANATAQLSEDVLAFVGVAYETPAQNSIKRVLLSLGAFYPNVVS